MADDHYGHIKISRKAYATDPYWNEPRVFSRWEAWEYLIQEASWSGRQWSLPGGHVIDLSRGETRPLSERHLGGEWRWGKKKVRVFLEALSADGKIASKNRTTQGTTYLIVNYEHYQGGGTGQGTTEEPGRNQAGTNTEAVKQAIERTNPSAGTEEEIEDQAGQLIIAANKGMRDNSAIGEQFNPIPAGHGSRQNVIDWLSDGVPFDLARSVVYDAACSYRPAGRNRQVRTMAYFDGAVRDAYDRLVAGQSPKPNGAAPPRSRQQHRTTAPQDYGEGTTEVPEWTK